MKKKLALFVAAILLIPVFAFSNIFTFKAGLFFPKAKSGLWQYELNNTDLTRAKFQNSNFSFAYEHFFSREISFMLSVDGYNRKQLGIYNNYVGREGEPYYYALESEVGTSLVHVFNVSITPLQLSRVTLSISRMRVCTSTWNWKRIERDLHFIRLVPPKNQVSSL